MSDYEIGQTLIYRENGRMDEVGFLGSTFQGEMIEYKLRVIKPLRADHGGYLSKVGEEFTCSENIDGDGRGFGSWSLEVPGELERLGEEALRKFRNSGREVGWLTGVPIS